MQKCKLLIITLLGACATLAGCTYLSGEESELINADEEAIHQLVTDYYTGLANDDISLILSTLCPDDAQIYLDNVEPHEDSGPPDEPVGVTVNLIEIQIAEPYATVRYQASMSNLEGVLYAQRLDNRWLLCKSAEYAIQDRNTPPPPTSR